MAIDVYPTVFYDLISCCVYTYSVKRAILCTKNGCTISMPMTCQSLRPLKVEIPPLYWPSSNFNFLFGTK
jgi:hypothetical protein